MTIETIQKKKIGNNKFVGIVLAGDYFEDWYRAKKMPHSIQDSDYVVCKFYDYHDGQKSHIEGVTTVGILKNLDHAKLIYNKIKKGNI